MLCHFVECICEEGMLKEFFGTTLRQQKRVEQFEILFHRYHLGRFQMLKVRKIMQGLMLILSLVTKEPARVSHIMVVASTSMRKIR